MSDDLYLSVVRRRIQQARLAGKLRQEDVADTLGISVRSYQRYESASPDNEFNPYLTTLRRIAQAIGIDVAAIVREPTEREVDDMRRDSPPRKRVRRSQG